MKLAFCLYRFFPFGGLQRDFIRIAKECVSRGHTVDVYTMKWEGELDPDFNIHIIPVKGLQNHTRAQHFVKQLNPIKAQYHLIVGFNKMPGLDVYYAADTCYQANARRKHGFVYRLTPRYRHLVNYENAVFNQHAKTEIVLISKLQKSAFISYYQTQARRFHLLSPGISRDRSAPENAHHIREQARAEFSLSPNDILLLMIGSGFKTKGLDRALLGLASLPPSLKQRCRFFIIGKDNAKPFLKQASKLKISQQIDFLGGRDDIAKFLLAADLLLHPAYNENTGTVLLEAVISGLPVLTTDACGYAHYIKEANAGLVVPSPYQQSEFNLTLEKMLSPLQLSEWSKNGLEFAKVADIYSMPQQATDLIESLALLRSIN